MTKEVFLGGREAGSLEMGVFGVFDGVCVGVFCWRRGRKERGPKKVS